MKGDEQNGNNKNDEENKMSMASSIIDVADAPSDDDLASGSIRNSKECLKIMNNMAQGNGEYALHFCVSPIYVSESQKILMIVIQF